MSEPYRRVDGGLEHEGNPLLQGMSADLELEPEPEGVGVFLVARARQTSSRLRFDLGAIVGLERYTVCHRYEPFWMKPQAGTSLAEVPAETQSLIGRRNDGRWVLLVPLVDEPFRFSLRGKPDHTLELLAETNDPFVPGLGGLAAFLAVGDDPFALATAGARVVSARLGGGPLRANKPLPDFADQFGWCTWDAFYQDVSHEKVRAGLESFAAGGISPRFVILDDGWQRTARRPTGELRLTSFAANDKFPGGLGATVRLAKEGFGVQTFLVWHAVIGYWGGVDEVGLPQYGVVAQPRQFGEGVLTHVPLCNQDWWGNLVGFVPPAQIAAFYDDYHGQLRAQGVDGVKVDNQAMLEAVSHGHGGRVAVARAYRAGLEASVQSHFAGRLLNCMSNAQETWYGSPGSSLIRSSIDFFPERPESHGNHLYTNAQVGVWFGEFMQPDWDMFQSGHEWGPFHAAARALSGGPLYVSDRPDCHDFELLSRLVCADGTVLRADGPARPTLDTLCHDPTREDLLLKIWNRCGKAGVLGVFHAQYAAAGPGRALSGEVSPSDVPGLVGTRFACYRQGAIGVERMTARDRRLVTLGQGGYAIFTFCPIEAGFAVVGLADKLNGAAAVTAESRSEGRVELDLRDGGALLAYSERPPRRAVVAQRTVPFVHDPLSGTLRVTLVERRRQRLLLEW